VSEQKGELKLCPKGQRLFDEYIELVEKFDLSKEYDLFNVQDYAWLRYYAHREECKECSPFL